MTLEEFINFKNPHRKSSFVRFTILNGAICAVFELKCKHLDILNLHIGERVSHFAGIKFEKLTLLNYTPMITTKEQVIKAYKQGSEEIKQLLLTLFENQFQGADLELLKKEDEIANLKKQLENCGK